MSRLRNSVLLVLALSAGLATAYPMVPHPEATPGDFCTRSNPDFNEYRYAEKIAHCSRQVSYGLKSAIYRDYEIDESCRKNYTIDHFIPLSFGGSNSQKNLWPEHTKVKQLRPNLELELFEQLRDGLITRDEAVKIIVDAKLHPPAPYQVYAKSHCDRPDPRTTY